MYLLKNRAVARPNEIRWPSRSVTPMPTTRLPIVPCQEEDSHPAKYSHRTKTTRAIFESLTTRRIPFSGIPTTLPAMRSRTPRINSAGKTSTINKMPSTMAEPQRSPKLANRRGAAGASGVPPVSCGMGPPQRGQALSSELTAKPHRLQKTLAGVTKVGIRALCPCSDSRSP